MLITFSKFSYSAIKQIKYAVQFTAQVPTCFNRFRLKLFSMHHEENSLLNGNFKLILTLYMKHRVIVLLCIVKETHMSLK